MAEGMGFSNSCLLEVRTPLDKPEEHRYGIHQKPASRCLDTRRRESSTGLITLKRPGVETHEQTVRRERLSLRVA